MNYPKDSLGIFCEVFIMKKFNKNYLLAVCQALAVLAFCVSASASWAKAPSAAKQGTYPEASAQRTYPQASARATNPPASDKAAYPDAVSEQASAFNESLQQAAARAAQEPPEVARCPKEWGFTFWDEPYYMVRNLINDEYVEAMFFPRSRQYVISSFMPRSDRRAFKRFTITSPRSGKVGTIPQWGEFGYQVEEILPGDFVAWKVYEQDLKFFLQREISYPRIASVSFVFSAPTPAIFEKNRQYFMEWVEALKTWEVPPTTTQPCYGRK